MGYERQCFLNAHPYQRSEQRVGQANGFYERRLTTRLRALELKVPRTGSGQLSNCRGTGWERRDGHSSLPRCHGYQLCRGGQGQILVPVHEVGDVG